jgi:DNA-binding NtrC family response regulator
MQEGEIMPVGSLERVKVDVRFLAASNRNLAEMVEAGDFRKDLYYRLNVIEISLPPLRGRSQDIPLLAEHFLQKYSREQGVAPKVLGKPAMRKLLKHRWPGNVRELENVIRRALIVSSGPVIKAHDIDISRPLSANISGRSDLFSMSYREAKKVVQSEFQRAYVRRLLSECEGSVSKAAHRAGLSRWAIHQMAKRYGLK